MDCPPRPFGGPNVFGSQVTVALQRPSINPTLDRRVYIRVQEAKGFACEANLTCTPRRTLLNWRLRASSKARSIRRLVVPSSRSWAHSKAPSRKPISATRIWDGLVAVEGILRLITLPRAVNSRFYPPRGECY